MSKRVLVTGGRGFIGRAVAAQLAHSGCRVIAMDQAPPKKHATDGKIREVLCDITQADHLRRIFEEEHIDGIIHLAAILPTAAQREPLAATQVNICGSLNLLEMARQFGIRRFVFGSSLSVYGTCGVERVVSETDRAAPEDLYGFGKAYVENAGEAYRNAHGVEFVSLRIGRTVGPGAQSASSAWRSQIFEFLGTKEPREITVPYVAAERVLLVHVEDVAKMLVTLLLAQRPVHCVYNSVCESVEVGELKRWVESLNPRTRFQLGATYATGNPRLLDVSRFQSEFGFQSTPIFDQLRNAAEARRA
jgi:nucleoside-diphosphate-sugar epimerase